MSSDLEMSAFSSSRRTFPSFKRKSTYRSMSILFLGEKRDLTLEISLMCLAYLVEFLSTAVNTIA